MRVTLLFPGIALPGFDSFKKRPSVDANFIDHGLASVGAAAKATGHEVGLIDLRALSGWEQFRSLVRTTDTPVWVWQIAPEHFSPSFFTPTAGSGMFDVVESQDLAVVDDFRGSCRSPDEAKIRGVDYAWLTRAIALAAAGGPESALTTLAGDAAGAGA